MNIYVGNLSYDVTAEELQSAFEGFGKVESVNVITDKLSGRSKGFAFVEMAEKAEAQTAIESLNGKELKGRALTVNEARPRTDRGGAGGGDRHGGGGRGPRSGGPGGNRDRRY
jgi:RNA recognition motif-containing protein